MESRCPTVKKPRDFSKWSFFLLPSAGETMTQTFVNATLNGIKQEHLTLVLVISSTDESFNSKSTQKSDSYEVIKTHDRQNFLLFFINTLVIVMSFNWSDLSKLQFHWWNWSLTKFWVIFQEEDKNLPKAVTEQKIAKSINKAFRSQKGFEKEE